jgi:integration host factor subunit alpha
VRQSPFGQASFQAQERIDGGEDRNTSGSGRGYPPATRPLAGESAELVGQVIEEICAALAAGEKVKLSSFGLFTVRDKGKRMGRNPKTGVEAPIEPHRSITFGASDPLKAYVNGGKKPRSG